jgi:hypothetical protein
MASSQELITVSNMCEALKATLFHPFGRWHAEQWSAAGTIVAAVMSFGNLITAFALLRFTRKTVKLMASQTEDIRTQARVAIEVLQREANEQRAIEAERAVQAIWELRKIRTWSHDAEELIFSRSVPTSEWPRNLDLSRWPVTVNALNRAFPGCTEVLVRYGSALHDLERMLPAIGRIRTNEDFAEFLPNLRAAFLAAEQGRAELFESLERNKIPGSEEAIRLIRESGDGGKG